MTWSVLLSVVITLVTLVGATEITSDDTSVTASLVDTTRGDAAGTTSPEVFVTTRHDQLATKRNGPEDGSFQEKLQEPLHDTVSKSTETDGRPQSADALHPQKQGTPEELSESMRPRTTTDNSAVAHSTHPTGDIRGNVEGLGPLGVIQAMNGDLESTKVPNQHNQSVQPDFPQTWEPPQNLTDYPVEEKALQETEMPNVPTDNIVATTGKNEQEYRKVVETTLLQTDFSTQASQQKTASPDVLHMQENIPNFSEVESDQTDSSLILTNTTPSQTMIEGSSTEDDNGSYVTTVGYSFGEAEKENTALETGCTPALCLDIARANITATPSSAKVERGDEVQFTCAQTTHFDRTERWFRLRWLGLERAGGSFQERPEGKGGRSRVLVGRVGEAQEMNFTCVPDIPIACCEDVGVTVELLVFEPPVYTTYMSIVGGLLLLSAVTCLVIYATHRKRYHIVASSDEADPEWQYVR